mmetsp:Transcript_27082/g.58392  ORF Transcript_27082/g.58392 Transcript_27082/m.58392 type:complete len:340 (-) Transcript_27082:408-1427(-)
MPPSVDFSSLFRRKATVPSDQGPPKKRKANGPTDAFQVSSTQKKKKKKKEKRKRAEQPACVVAPDVIMPSAPDKASRADGAVSKKQPHHSAESNIDRDGVPVGVDRTSTRTISRQKAARSSTVQGRMAEQLMGARFREINELLYTQNSAISLNQFLEEPSLFEAYHSGFRLQAQRWPERPVDEIISWLRAQPVDWQVGDMGCGDAEIAASVPQRVHSFDLLPTNERVTACDIAHVPLPDASLDVAVFCLSLMGANYVDFLREAHRLLRGGGHLRIAEVASRFEGGAPSWIAMLRQLGFDLVERDESNTHFVLLAFVKAKRAPAVQVQTIPLKPCLYKRR